MNRRDRAALKTWCEQPEPETFANLSRAQRRAIRRVLKGMMTAADELMIEFVAKRRATNWGLVNEGLVNAQQLLHVLQDRR